MLRYRREDRPVIHTNGTYIHSIHMKTKGCSKDSGQGMLTPVSKGQKGMRAQAGGQYIFITDALLTFKSQQKSGDYHDDMKCTNFTEWIVEKLILIGQHSESLSWTLPPIVS